MFETIKTILSCVGLWLLTFRYLCFSFVGPLILQNG
jgi:hypothetical protein